LKGHLVTATRHGTTVDHPRFICPTNRIWPTPLEILRSGDGLPMSVVDVYRRIAVRQSVTRRTAALATAAVVMASVAAMPLLSADAAVQPAAGPPSDILVHPRPSAAAEVRMRENANPLSRTSGLFVDPQLPAARWVAAHPGDKRSAAIRAAVSRQPMAHWFTGTSDADMGQAVGKYTSSAQAAGKLPVLVAYNLPHRDACGAESAGGASSPAIYTKWMSTFATAIGVRPAIVILEPDALGDFRCMTAAQITTRLRLLNAATRMLTEKAPNAWTYIDAGHANWSSPATIAKRLLSAGVSRVRGFAGTAGSRRYAEQVKAALHRPAAYVIDTSRNGNGGNGQWCNPSGRKLGKRSTADPAALELWIKNPGSSDGRCGIAPTIKAGVFSPALAQRLIAGK
jgi:endoglucanase